MPFAQSWCASYWALFYFSAHAKYTNRAWGFKLAQPFGEITQKGAGVVVVGNGVGVAAIAAELTNQSFAGQECFGNIQYATGEFIGDIAVEVVAVKVDF